MLGGARGRLVCGNGHSSRHPSSCSSSYTVTLTSIMQGNLCSTLVTTSSNEL